MTFEIAFTVLVLGAGLALFIKEPVSLEVTALSILAVFLVTGMLTLENGVEKSARDVVTSFC